MRKWLSNSLLVTAIAQKLEKRDELFEGVEKPTVTLAHMLAAEMLQNLHLTNVYGVNSTSHRFQYPTFTLEYYKSPVRDSLRNPIKGLFTYDIQGIELTAAARDERGNYKSFAFKEREKQILIDAIKKIEPLREKARENEAESKRQQAAIDVIEALFKKGSSDAHDSPQP
jgi:hypothetical protein